ncbi:MAG: sulfotransferase domain-containing protein [Anaerolineales bacterium]
MLLKKIRSLFKKSRKPEIIVVSGLPRSGTSMMMEILHAGGISLLTDNLRKADQDNPRGYFEWERVKKLSEGNHAWLSDAVGKAVKIIAPLLPYLPDAYQYKVVFMNRNMEEILSSQRKMLQRRGEGPQGVEEEKMKDIFEKNLDSVFQFMNANDNVSYIICDYNDILRDPTEDIEKIRRFLDLESDIDGMVDVVDPALYRQRVS